MAVNNIKKKHLNFKTACFNVLEISRAYLFNYCSNVAFLETICALHLINYEMNHNNIEILYAYQCGLCI